MIQISPDFCVAAATVRDLIAVPGRDLTAVTGRMDCGLRESSLGCWQSEIRTPAAVYKECGLAFESLLKFFTSAALYGRLSDFLFSLLDENISNVKTLLAYAFTINNLPKRHFQPFPTLIFFRFYLKINISHKIRKSIFASSSFFFFIVLHPNREACVVCFILIQNVLVDAIIIIIMFQYQ